MKKPSDVPAVGAFERDALDGHRLQLLPQRGVQVVICFSLRPLKSATYDRRDAPGRSPPYASLAAPSAVEGPGLSGVEGSLMSTKCTVRSPDVTARPAAPRDPPDRAGSSPSRRSRT